MGEIEKATLEDTERLTEIQTRTFQDDNKLKPPGCNMGGPPGYDSVNWNAGWIEKTPYYKILYNGQIVGGIIIFELGEKRYELGRMWVDPDFQNRRIGRQAARQMFEAFPEADQWILGTGNVRNSV